MKKTWDEILPEKCERNPIAYYMSHEYKRGFNDCREFSVRRLKQAEKDGLVCINPPTKEEIREIIEKFVQDNKIDGILYSWANKFVDLLYQRIYGKDTNHEN